jgi:hypothetical protein|tara:strand:- start:336 stop:1007 length:672 start_codon:yes stop_codon:yes gene_type:complete
MLLTEYKKHLTIFDKTYVGENKVTDSKGRFYEDGISQLNEIPTKELLFNKLFGDTVEYEVPYKTLTTLPPFIKKSPSLDALVDGYKAYEYKKTHILYNNGGVNEYALKTLLTPLAAESYINPNTNKSVASQSVIGDIEKLLMLPDKFEKYILLELWSGGGYTSDSYLNMLDTTLTNYYEGYKDKIIYKDSIHPILDTCDIILYQIFNKKGVNINVQKKEKYIT